MAVAVDKTAQRFLNIATGVDLNCAFSCFAATDVEVFYGIVVPTLAVLNTDYTVTLNEIDGYENFIVTPLAALLTKINAVIAADLSGTEINYATVRREMDFLTSTTPETVRYTSFLSLEFDRMVLRMQQLEEAVSRSVTLAPNNVGDIVNPITVPVAVPGAALIWSADGTSIVNGPDAADLAEVEIVAAAAAASAATATTQAGIATAGAGTATTQAAIAVAAAASIFGFVTGDAVLSLSSAARTGFVKADDGTIGDAASGATTRANADCAALYAVLWAISDTYAPVTGGRGANAAADFAAHKKIGLTKTLGMALAVAGAGAGLTARALGLTVGEETHALSTAELASHTHTTNETPHAHAYQQQHAGASINVATGSPGNDAGIGTTGSSTTGITINTAGSGTAHNNMQPTSFWNIYIKL